MATEAEEVEVIKLQRSALREADDLISDFAAFYFSEYGSMNSLPVAIEVFRLIESARRRGKKIEIELE